MLVGFRAQGMVDFQAQGLVVFHAQGLMEFGTFSNLEVSLDLLPFNSLLSFN